jgi:transposase
VAHGSARLTVHGRTLLITRVLYDKRPVSHVARELGISRQCAHRWVSRFRLEGAAGLVDRSSRPRSMPRRRPLEVEQRVLALRVQLRQGQDRIGPVAGVPARTVGAILRRHGVPRLSECDPLTGQIIRASKQTAIRMNVRVPVSWCIWT